ncbi:inactive receptor [Vigna angularis]|uniref:Inactive receptor n=1 Tax=Phaseolus angularis TaxID=3914 RepID=A0A8T0L8D2_PHAAN|nr:inactive receptor [Vigna angularis]
MGLSGSLPSGLGNLTELQTLSLRFNALTGPIPADFINLKALRNLYLQGNFFSGEVPDAVFALQNLVRLNLGNNNFSGEISPKFNGLTRLSTLYLKRNNFTGSIPDLTVPPLDQFNVSYNSLTGPIPNRFSSLDQTAFLGNSLCGKPLQSCPGTEEGKSKLSGGAIAGIVIGFVVGLLLILLLLFFLCRKRSEKTDESVSTGKRDVGGKRI